jgi:hypothetical protein
LEALFGDVGFSHIETDLSDPTDNLPNLGPTSTAWLRDAGIKTIVDLERLGSVPAYRLAKLPEPDGSCRDFGDRVRPKLL